MATCKWCGKSGFFISVNQYGLCGDCNYSVTPDAKERFQLINNSIKVVMKSKNLDTKLSQLDFIIEEATYLLKYENKNINMFSVNPSVIIKEAQKDKIEAITKNLLDEYNKILSKIDVSTSFISKLNDLNKLHSKVQNYRSLPDLKIDNLEKQIKNKKHEIQLDNFLETARKAEFKNEAKKAISQYQEALYFLKNDDIDDKFQKENIKKIEEKIKELLIVKV